MSENEPTGAPQPVRGRPRDQVTLGRVPINTDFLYHPFKGGESVLGGEEAPKGRQMQIPPPCQLRVVMGQPPELRYQGT